MYLYNITTNIDENYKEEWLNWMKSIHIPAMLATGKFSKAKILQVMIDEEMGGITYSVQYTTDSIETLQEYYRDHAAILNAEGLKLFKDKFVSFKTELKVITEIFSTSLAN